MLESLSLYNRDGKTPFTGRWYLNRQNILKPHTRHRIAALNCQPFHLPLWTDTIQEGSGYGGLPLTRESHLPNRLKYKKYYRGNILPVDKDNCAKQTGGLTIL